MKEKSRWRRLSVSLPFWWIVLTAVYLPFSFSFIGGGMVLSLAGLVGLFVPMGIWNFSASRENGVQFITFPLVLLVVFGGGWILDRQSFSRAAKLFLIAGILLALTLAVDLIIWGKWASLSFFFVQMSPKVF
jgi:hypothetical protein